MLIIAGREAHLRRAIESITKDLTESVTRDLQGIKSVSDLAHRVRDLRAQVETLETEKARKQEEFSRREREVEHKVGLERKRQEFELTSAKREAVLAVREENLKADRARFEEQMGFHEKRFTEEVSYLKELMTEIMKRLPDVSLTGEVPAGKGARRG